MVSKQLCPYCKITHEQVTSASNRKVKEYRKTGNTDMIHFTNVIPSDLSRLKIILYTIFFGLIGVNHYYILRPVRGTFACVSTASAFFMALLPFIIEISTKVGKSIYNIIFDIVFLAMTFNLIMWFSDLIGVIFGTFKVPVVLGNKKENK